jgi:hypothetical protein
MKKNVRWIVTIHFKSGETIQYICTNVEYVPDSLKIGPKSEAKIEAAKLVLDFEGRCGELGCSIKREYEYSEINYFTTDRLKINNIF